MDHYDTLGVDKDASEEEIKKAYRKKSAENHPDRGGDPEAMKSIIAAYSTLGNSRKRKHYDQTGEDAGETLSAPEEQIAISFLDQAVQLCAERKHRGSAAEAAIDLLRRSKEYQDVQNAHATLNHAVKWTKRTIKTVKRRNRRKKHAKTLVLAYLENKHKQYTNDLKETKKVLKHYQLAVDILSSVEMPDELAESDLRRDMDRQQYTHQFEHITNQIWGKKR
jgi:curved DNA-binding protein CbpA